ncbi:MAG: transposase [Thermodesulfobacteriota bacterium]|nr:transposase [Thermodesulfobacteriota bacterium]
MNIKRHQPRHLYVDNQIYFITSHIHNRTFLLDDDSKKDKLLLKIFKFAWENKIELHAWVILKNHYHILCKVSDGRDISRYIGDIHQGFTFEMNEIEEMRGRRLWKNYWDWCVRNETDYWMHFNYIHNNPIKHGIVRDLDSLKGYRYSSFWNYMRREGIQWLMSAIEAHPIVDFLVENDE